ncbi:MAG TPA: 4-(cytidine 5'-diphospho)-2-C-methyl-D-erythritol kinase [Clostridia bacterium]|nr:4-(cytidine 5'-diphospho)-2-C-methyl-D-erythritol kinase [Clostridia bacterium]
MNTISVRVCGKINLTLDVVGKRSDGYHDVDMIMQSVDLWDEIVLGTSREGIDLNTNMEGLPCDDSNIAWRATQLVKEGFNISEGVDIFLKKNIPMEAGMAGGSADCAGVLLGLNILWDLGMDSDQLRSLGKSLGADVPFCLMGGTALAQGIGDKLTPIDSKKDMWLVIVKPDFGVSTQEIYGGLRLDRIDRRPNNLKVIELLRLGEIAEIGSNLVNVLEEVTIPMHPIISHIKLELLELGAFGSLMSGSGPSVYGIFKDKSSAHRVANILKRKYGQVFALKTTGTGIYME